MPRYIALVIVFALAPAFAAGEQVRYRFAAADAGGAMTQVPIGPEGSLGELNEFAFALDGAGLGPKLGCQLEAAARQPIEIGIFLVDQRLDPTRGGRMVGRVWLGRSNQQQGHESREEG